MASLITFMTETSKIFVSIKVSSSIVNILLSEKSLKRHQFELTVLHIPWVIKYSRSQYDETKLHQQTAKPGNAITIRKNIKNQLDRKVFLEMTSRRLEISAI